MAEESHDEAVLSYGMLSPEDKTAQSHYLQQFITTRIECKQRQNIFLLPIMLSSAPIKSRLVVS